VLNPSGSLAKQVVDLRSDWGVQERLLNHHRTPHYSRDSVGLASTSPFKGHIIQDITPSASVLNYDVSIVYKLTISYQIKQDKHFVLTNYYYQVDTKCLFFYNIIINITF